MNDSQNSQLLLSIIIPLYNSSNYIKTTVGTILKCNDNSNLFEIVLIDDGSKDSTPDICQQLINDNPNFNISYYKKSNGGIASARNYGISKSSGKYLFFHDHDDIFENSNLSTILDILNNNSYDLIIFEADDIVDGNKKPSRIVYNNANLFSQDFVQNDLFLTMFDLNKNKQITNYFGSIWTVILNKQFVIDNKLSFIYFRDYEDDFLFLFNVLFKKPSIGSYKIKIYNWINNINSTSHTVHCDLNKLQGIENFASYVKEKLIGTKYDCLASSIYNGILFTDYYDAVLAFYFCNKKLKYKEAKLYCYNDKIRSKIISPIKKTINYKKRIIRFFYKFKLYWICHLVIKFYFK